MFLEKDYFKGNPRHFGCKSRIRIQSLSDVKLWPSRSKMLVSSIIQCMDCERATAVRECTHRRLKKGYRKYRSLGTPPRLAFRAQFLHNQEGANAEIGGF